MSEETNPIVNEELPAESPLKGVKAYKALFPVLIGLGVVAFIFYREFRPEAMSFVSWTQRCSLVSCRSAFYVWARSRLYLAYTYTVRQAS